MSIVIPVWLHDYIPEGDIVSLGRGCIWIKGERDCKVKFSETALGSQLLQREALWLSRVCKTNVSTNKLQDLIKDANRTVMITDYIRGMSASCWIANYSAVCFDRTSEASSKLAGYVESLFKSVDCLHSSKIIHGDIKPGNVIFAEDGFSYLIDFSNTRRFSEPLNNRGLVQYTPSYRYPVAHDLARYEHDYYALTVMLAALLTGKMQPHDTLAEMNRLIIKVKKLGLSEEYFTRFETYISCIRKDLNP